MANLDGDFSHSIELRAWVENISSLQPIQNYIWSSVCIICGWNFSRVAWRYKDMSLAFGHLARKLRMVPEMWNEYYHPHVMLIYMCKKNLGWINGFIFFKPVHFQIPRFTRETLGSLCILPKKLKTKFIFFVTEMTLIEGPS